MYLGQIPSVFDIAAGTATVAKATSEGKSTEEALQAGAQAFSSRVGNRAAELAQKKELKKEQDFYKKIVIGSGIALIAALVISKIL